MTAMFPDSGVPYQDARNSLPAPVVADNCDPLWYSTSRCQPRFDPAAANAMLAEMINLINKGEVEYDCSLLDQAQLSVRYLIQRGIPRGGPLAGGPANYTLALDPPATRYNDYMTLTVIPNVNNNGPVNLNLQGLGDRDLLRNDGQELRENDLTANHPIEIAFWNGAWWHLGLVTSQALLSSQARFETPGSYTWVAPTGVYVVIADVYSGGGGGGTGDAAHVGGGGGAAGGFARRRINVIPGTGYSVVVGAGGPGGGPAGAVQAGFNGGASSFAGLVSATGGAGGNAGINPIPGIPMVYAGIGVGGDINLRGAAGSSGASGTNSDGGYTGYGGLGGAAPGPEGGGGGCMSTGSAGGGISKGGGGSGGGSGAGENSPGGPGADGAVILSYIG